MIQSQAPQHHDLHPLTPLSSPSLAPSFIHPHHLTHPHSHTSINKQSDPIPGPPAPRLTPSHPPTPYHPLTSTHTLSSTHTLYTLPSINRVIQSQAPQHHEFVIVVDCAGFGFSSIPPFATMKVLYYTHTLTLLPCYLVRYPTNYYVMIATHTHTHTHSSQP